MMKYVRVSFCVLLVFCVRCLQASELKKTVSDFKKIVVQKAEVLEALSGKAGVENVRGDAAEAAVKLLETQDKDKNIKSACDAVAKTSNRVNRLVVLSKAQDINKTSDNEIKYVCFWREYEKYTNAVIEFAKGQEKIQIRESDEAVPEQTRKWNSAVFDFWEATEKFHKVEISEKEAELATKSFTQRIPELCLSKLRFFIRGKGFWFVTFPVTTALVTLLVYKLSMKPTSVQAGFLSQLIKNFNEQPKTSPLLLGAV